MAVRMYQPITVTFTTDSSKSTSYTIYETNNGALHITSASNCTLEAEHNGVYWTVAPPEDFTSSTTIIVYPTSDNWEVVCTSGSNT